MKLAISDKKEMLGRGRGLSLLRHERRILECEVGRNQMKKQRLFHSRRRPKENTDSSSGTLMPFLLLPTLFIAKELSQAHL